jgi:hypothetical protein
MGPEQFLITTRFQISFRFVEMDIRILPGPLSPQTAGTIQSLLIDHQRKTESSPNTPVLDSSGSFFVKDQLEVGDFYAQITSQSGQTYAWQEVVQVMVGSATIGWQVLPDGRSGTSLLQPAVETNLSASVPINSIVRLKLTTFLSAVVLNATSYDWVYTFDFPAANSRQFFPVHITAMNQATLLGAPPIGMDSCIPIGSQIVAVGGWFLYTWTEQMVACNGGYADLPGGRSGNYLSNALRETNNHDVSSLIPFYADARFCGSLNGNNFYVFTKDLPGGSFPPIGPPFGPPFWIPITIIIGFNPITGAPITLPIWVPNPACGCLPPYISQTYMKTFDPVTCAFTTGIACVILSPSPCCPPGSKPTNMVTGFDPSSCTFSSVQICAFLQ